jgi:hypothetical protein
VLVGGASAAIVRARSGAPALVVTSKNAKTSIVFNINKPLGNPVKPLALENKAYKITFSSTKEARNTPGVANAFGKFHAVKEGDTWLKGQFANVGRVPAQIADKMRGQYFKNWDEFRGTFWKHVANDAILSKEFDILNLSRMQKGIAPLTRHECQKVGKLESYNLHHKKPIQKGGPVYDLDNIIVATPVYHSQFHVKKVKQKINS